MINLSAKQQAAAAAAITLLAVGFIVAVSFCLFILLGWFFIFFSRVFLPLAVAGILALMLKPYYEWLRKAVRFRLLAVALVFLTLLVPLVGFCWFFGSLVVQQATDLVRDIPHMLEHLQEKLEARWPEIEAYWEKHGLETRVRELVQEQGGAIARSLGQIGAGVLAAGVGIFRTVAGYLGWFVLPVYLGFFLMAQAPAKMNADGLLPFLKPETRRDVVYLATEFVKIVVAFFRGQIVIALLQGVMYAIGFALAGLKYGILIGFIMGLLNIVPYLGSMVGLAMSLPMAYFQPGGGWDQLMWTALVIVVVQAIEGNLLTPKIMGERTGLHPVLIIFAMFFWGTALNGIMGMILAIPLTAFAAVFWRLAKTRYIREIF
jgi:predicted PurR-regulated permease PerM